MFFVGNTAIMPTSRASRTGSTPPVSRTLEEGVVIDDFCWSMEDDFAGQELRALLDGAKYPARASPDVNVADIKAQVAADEKGVQELQHVDMHVWLAGGQRMHCVHVMDNAEEWLRQVIDRLNSWRGSSTPWTAVCRCASLSASIF